ncbi:MAG: hypothetical protein H0V40_13425 [Actinobacteria bacterium]|nr:hypothetical protein [Actinomycetota bacterium]
MQRTRGFSQAISEGDGISVLADVDTAEAARRAESEGADGVALRRPLDGVRQATELALLWLGSGSLAEARTLGADACLLVFEEVAGEEGRLEQLHAEVLELGLECVVEVRDEDELQLALERVDPELLLLSARRAQAGGGLEHVLGLLLDVPAGKLAIAEVGDATPAEVAELERAGVDAVIVRAAAVSALVQGAA